MMKSHLISVTVKWQRQRDESRKCFNELLANFNFSLSSHRRASSISEKPFYYHDTKSSRQSWSEWSIKKFNLILSNKWETWKLHKFLIIFELFCRLEILSTARSLSHRLNMVRDLRKRINLKILVLRNQLSTFFVIFLLLCDLSFFQATNVWSSWILCFWVFTVNMFGRGSQTRKENQFSFCSKIKNRSKRIHFHRAFMSFSFRFFFKNI